MNFFITIDQDEDAMHPRDDFEHLGTLYTWHRRYTLGGKDDENHQPVVENIHTWVFDNFNEVANLPELKGYHSYENEMLFEDEELNIGQRTFFVETINCWMNDNLCIVPIYMYDHSGITISTGPFSCPWDSGQVGFIYVTKETCDKQGENFDNAEKIIKGEIETLDAYLTGNVYGYTIWETEEEVEDEIYNGTNDFNSAEVVDSCYGYYGYDYCKESALSILKAFQKDNEKGQLELFTPEILPAI